MLIRPIESLPAVMLLHAMMKVLSMTMVLHVQIVTMRNLTRDAHFSPLQCSEALSAYEWPVQLKGWIDEQALMYSVSERVTRVMPLTERQWRDEAVWRQRDLVTTVESGRRYPVQNGHSCDLHHRIL